MATILKGVMLMTDYREILRLQSLGLNHSQIAESVGASRQNVIAVLQRAAARSVDWLANEFCLVHAKFIREMSKPGVTLQLLWFEYSDKCRESGEIPYQLTQFKKYYRDFALKTKVTMHITRKPGEIMEVYSTPRSENRASRGPWWAGQTAAVVDADTGAPVEFCGFRQNSLDAYIFVAALPYSGYSYVEAFFSQDQECQTAAHVNAYNFFGGVTRILVPDNPGVPAKPYFGFVGWLEDRRRETHPARTHPEPRLSGNGRALRNRDHPDARAHA
jgi:hypothetical protein